MTQRTAILAAAALLLPLAACTPASDEPTVFAAASLNAVLPEIEPNANYSFDGSAGLVDQLAGGAPADVFASADQRNMERAVAAGLIDGEPRLFATNHLVLVVPKGNPAGVTGFDASLDGVKLVVCAEEVPCGAATQRLAAANDVVLQPVSEETKVTDVLGKIASGEGDAGLVYATDAAGAGADVETIEIPESAQHVNEYWIVAVKDGDADKAAAFIELVTGAEGQELLAGYGFGPA